jgi:cyclopropane fatty-acyl-phospholipid synthase-like methyltransferase
MIDAPPKQGQLGPSPFSSYERHYGGMGNVAPDWSAAQRDPSRFAARKPWLPVSRDVRVLDFGCGWGHQLLALWAAGYRRLDGVELVLEQARIARASAGGRCEIFCADGRDFLAERPMTYDLVVMNDVIEHIPPSETGALLRVIHAALRPGGRIVVRTPNMASLLAAYSRYIDATHATGFTEISLTQVLEQAGFASVRYVSDFELNPRLWRPWRPLDHIGVRAFVNVAIHRFLYAARGQSPRATRFGMNLEAWADKRA